MFDPNAIAFGEEALASASRSTGSTPISPEGGGGTGIDFLDGLFGFGLALGGAYLSTEVQKDILRDQIQIKNLENELNKNQSNANPSQNIQAPNVSFVEKYKTPLVVAAAVVAAVIAGRAMKWI